MRSCINNFCIYTVHISPAPEVWRYSAMSAVSNGIYNVINTLILVCASVRLSMTYKHGL